MKVKFLESLAGNGIAYAAGEVKDLAHAEAMDWISQGLAEPFEDIEKDAEPLKPERPLKPQVQRVKKQKTRPQNVKASNKRNK